jgi:hypothetical protein
MDNNKNEIVLAGLASIAIVGGAYLLTRKKDSEEEPTPPPVTPPLPPQSEITGVKVIGWRNATANTPFSTNPVSFAKNDEIIIRIGYTYVGSATNLVTRVAIFERVVGIIDEKDFRDGSIGQALSLTPTEYFFDLTVKIADSYIGGKSYGVYGKVQGQISTTYDSALLAEKGYVLTIVPVPSNVRINVTRTPEPDSFGGYAPNTYVTLTVPMNTYAQVDSGGELRLLVFDHWSFGPNEEPFPAMNGALTVVMTHDITVNPVYKVADVLPPWKPGSGPNVGSWYFATAVTPASAGELLVTPNPANGTFADGQVVQIKATGYGTSSYGYSFDFWEISEGNIVRKDYSALLSLTMRANTFVAAHFKFNN